MTTATIALLLVTCTLVNSRRNDVLRTLPSPLKDVHQSLAKRQTPCPYGGSVDVSAAKVDNCSKVISTVWFARPDAYDAAFCSDCGQVLYDYYAACDRFDGVSRILEAYCSTNENGDRCSSVLDSQGGSVKAACSDTLTDDTCSSRCENTLQTSIEDTGCCTYGQVAAIFTTMVANDIWNTCNRQTPAPCENPFSTTESTALPVSVNVLTVTNAIVFAVALLQV